MPAWQCQDGAALHLCHFSSVGPGCEACPAHCVVRWGRRGGGGVEGAALHPGGGAPDRGWGRAGCLGRGVLGQWREVFAWGVVDMGRRAVCWWGGGEVEGGGRWRELDQSHLEEKISVGHIGNEFYPTGLFCLPRISLADTIRHCT